MVYQKANQKLKKGVFCFFTTSVLYFQKQNKTARKDSTFLVEWQASMIPRLMRTSVIVHSLSPHIQHCGGVIVGVWHLQHHPPMSGQQPHAFIGLQTFWTRRSHVFTSCYWGFFVIKRSKFCLNVQTCSQLTNHESVTKKTLD